MGAPYSLDLRERVVAAVEGGMSRAEAARQFQVSHSTAIRWTKRKTQTGSPAALPMGGRKPFKLAGEAAWIRARVAEKPDITGRELLAELRARGVAVSYFAVWHFLDRAALTFKKKPARQRTGPRRCRPPAPAMAKAAGERCSATLGVHRRDMGQDQHDPNARPLRERPAPGRQGAAWLAQNADLCRRPALRRHQRPLRDRRPD
jgi:transposase